VALGNPSVAIQYIGTDHKVILLEQGTVTGVDTYDHVVQSNTPFAQTMIEFVKKANTEMMDKSATMNLFTAK
jgi:hypothetical protein